MIQTTFRSLVLALVMSLLSSCVAEASWKFCWLQYPRAGAAGQSGWNGAIGWATDFPNAGENLAQFFEERTMVTAAPWHMNRFGRTRPQVTLIDIEDSDDTALFTCPLVYTQDVASMGLSHVGEQRLKTYLSKGGMLWIDDAWGWDAWNAFQRDVVSKVAPQGHLVDVPPALRHALFKVPDDVVQIPDVRSYRSGQGTTERDVGGPAKINLIVNRNDEPMIIICHDTDFGDPWARQENKAYFLQYGPTALAYGVNIILYAMTH